MIHTKFWIRTQRTDRSHWCPADTNHIYFGVLFLGTGTYSLTIRATDGGDLYDDVILDITIDDVNDNFPVFVPGRFNFVVHYMHKKIVKDYFGKIMKWA